MNIPRNIARRQQGFTLIELIMVIVIIGILAAVAVPKFSDLSSSAQDAANENIAGSVNSGCMTLFAEHRVNGAAASDFATTLDDVIPTTPSGWTNWTTTTATSPDGGKTLTLTGETATAPCSATLADV